MVNEYIGQDTDGVTRISLDNLKKIAQDGAILEKVEISVQGSSNVCSFIFKDHTAYNASGFSIGYGGEGPHGLHEAIYTFCPSSIDSDFWKTPISQLPRDKNWNWLPEKGFVFAG